MPKKPTTPKATEASSASAAKKPVAKATPKAAPKKAAAPKVKAAAVPKPAKAPVAQVKATAVTKPALSVTPADIALRAYFIAEKRQKLGLPGDSTSDWVEAERQLQAKAALKAKE